MLITDIVSAFHQGKELANAATWKNRAAAGNALAGLVTAGLGIAAALGYHINIDSQTVQVVAAGVAALVCLLNGGVHVVTDASVGLPPKSDGAGGVSPFDNGVGVNPADVEKFLGNRDASKL